MRYEEEQRVAARMVSLQPKVKAMESIVEDGSEIVTVVVWAKVIDPDSNALLPTLTPAQFAGYLEKYLKSAGIYYQALRPEES